MKGEYRTAKGWQILIYVLCSILLIGCSFGTFAILQDSKNESITSFIIYCSLFGGMILFWLYCILETIKWKTIISKNSIKVVSLFRTKELAFSSIKGVKTDENQTYFIPLNKPSPTIKVGKYTTKYREIVEWAYSNFKDLDLEEYQEAEKELLRNEAFGRSEEERELRLKEAKRATTITNTIGGILGALLMFFPVFYNTIMLIAIIFPVLVLLVLYFYKDLIRFLDEEKNSPYPNLGFSMLVFIGICLRALLDISILNYENVWGYTLFISGILAILFILIGKAEFSFKKKTTWFLRIMLLFLLTTAYGYGTCVMYNSIYDESEAKHFQVKVLDKHKSSGRTTSYYLKVEPWASRKTAENITVAKEFYNTTRVGDDIHIYLMKGKLDIPWFTVSD